MTKRDYEAIAKALHGVGKTSTGQCDFHEVVTNLSQIFAQANPRFNSEKFFLACGLQTVGTA